MKIKILQSVMLLMLFSGSASAGFINTDWKVAGDNRAMLHEETGIEWLKLNETAGMSMSQTGNDIAFEGWRLATDMEVEALMVGFFPAITFNEERTIPSVTREEASRWFLAIGASGGGSTARGIGIYNKDGNAYASGAERSTNSARLFDDVGPYAFGAETGGFSASFFSVFLVSDGGTTLSSLEDPTLNQNNPNYGAAPVPAPATMGLMGIGMLMLLIRRRSKNA